MVADSRQTACALVRAPFLPAHDGDRAPVVSWARVGGWHLPQPAPLSLFGAVDLQPSMLVYQRSECAEMCEAAHRPWLCPHPPQSPPSLGGQRRFDGFGQSR